MLLKGRPFSKQKTDISNIPKIREVARSLQPSSAQDSAKHRAKMRRQFRTRPISQKTATIKTDNLQTSRGPYRVLSYSSDSGLWVVSSSVQPGEFFLATPIKAGTIGVGDLLRGYHVYGDPLGYIEPKPQGRRFKPEPIDDFIFEEIDEIEFQLLIAFTGKK